LRQREWFAVDAAPQFFSIDGDGGIGPRFRGAAVCFREDFGV
jgi:hypothetical protein